MGPRASGHRHISVYRSSRCVNFALLLLLLSFAQAYSVWRHAPAEATDANVEADREFASLHQLERRVRSLTASPSADSAAQMRFAAVRKRSSEGIGPMGSATVSAPGPLASQPLDLTNIGLPTNVGSTQIQSDKMGHHLIVLRSNNQLLKPPGAASEQVIKAAAAQSIASFRTYMNQRAQQRASEQQRKQKLQLAVSNQIKQGNTRILTAVSEQQFKFHESTRLRLYFQIRFPWTVVAGGFAQPSVTRVGDLCVVQGAVVGTKGLIAVLGPDCRPVSGRLIFTVLHGKRTARVDVLPDGRVFHIAGPKKVDTLSLSGISFTVGVDQPFSLLNGWTDFGYSYRPTTLNKIGDVCVLSGLVGKGVFGQPFGQVSQLAVSNNAVFGQLCSPNQQLIFSANNHQSVARVDVFPTGVVQWMEGAASYGWMSLDGLAWCVADGGSAIPINPPSNWLPLGSSYRPPRLCVAGTMCVLSGAVTSPSWLANGGLILHLPPVCRPTLRLMFGVYTHNNNARLDILPTGELLYIGGQTDAPWLSLDGIKFITAAVSAPAVTGPPAPTASVQSA